MNLRHATLPQFSRGLLCVTLLSTINMTHAGQIFAINDLSGNRLMGTFEISGLTGVGLEVFTDPLSKFHDEMHVLLDLRIIARNIDFRMTDGNSFPDFPVITFNEGVFGELDFSSTKNGVTLAITGPFYEVFTGFADRDLGMFSVSLIPEPSTYALFGMGICALGYIRKRKYTFPRN